MSIRTGLDTGFFVLLAQNHERAVQLWTEVTEGRRDGVVSAVALFELDRLGLRGAVPSSFVTTAQELIPYVCEIVWIIRTWILPAS